MGKTDRADQRPEESDAETPSGNIHQGELYALVATVATIAAMNGSQCGWYGHLSCSDRPMVAASARILSGCSTQSKSALGSKSSVRRVESVLSPFDPGRSLHETYGEQKKQFETNIEGEGKRNNEDRVPKCNLFNLSVLSFSWACIRDMIE